MPLKIEDKDKIKAHYLLDGWHGRSSHPVKIIGETPKKYRCQLQEDGPLGGRNRWGIKGQIVLIPKTAVRLTKNK